MFKTSNLPDFILYSFFSEDKGLHPWWLFSWVAEKMWWLDFLLLIVQATYMISAWGIRIYPYMCSDDCYFLSLSLRDFSKTGGPWYWSNQKQGIDVQWAIRKSVGFVTVIFYHFNFCNPLLSIADAIMKSYVNFNQNSMNFTQNHKIRFP